MTTKQLNPRFRKAITVASEVALRAGELHSSITDGEEVTEYDIRDLGRQIVTVNSKRKSLVDASTAAFFYDAAGFFGEAGFAIYYGDTGLAAEKLDQGAAVLEGVEAHVMELFNL